MNFNNPISNSQSGFVMPPDKEVKQREEIKDLVLEKMNLKGITPNFTEFVKVQPDYQRWIPQGPTKKPQ